jgi:ketosteroid isomerase-like protein
LDGTRVLALFRFGGRGKSSGVRVGEIGSEGAHVFHLRDDKVARIDAYWNRDRALADLRLEE